MSGEWKCSKCGEVPEVMQANTDPKLCVKCYDEEQASRPFTPPPFDTGSRVATPGGAGEVAYVRMEAGSSPGAPSIGSVGVILDNKKHQPGYTGTVYLVELVTAIPKPVSRNRI